MVTLTCTTESTGGITLVTARLTGGTVPQRVALDNRLDGPVWPPRREGVPEAGWHDGGFETVVPAETTVAVGYASPAPPTDSPLEIADRAVLADDARSDGHATAATPSETLRDLGDPAPPRDAVPIPIDEATRRTTPERASEDPPVEAAPGPVSTWLDAVEERVALAERLTAADSLPTATAALREAGGLDEARGVVDDLETDRERLAAVVERAERLAERADETDVPLATLDRIA